MKINSNKEIINASVQEVFEFLSDTQNIGKLLPQNEVKDFQSTATECSFKVQGGITISLVQKALNPYQEIQLNSGEKSPFPFQLSVLFKEVDGGTEGYIAFDGEVNAFLQMMVKKPLTNLFNHMSGELKKIYA